MRTARVWATTAFMSIIGVCIGPAAFACEPARASAQGDRPGGGEDMVLLDDGSIYAAGVFRQTTDFDPGPGVDERTAKGGFDVFVTKYRADGSYEWTRTFGTAGDDESFGLVSRGDGSLVLRALQSGRRLIVPVSRARQS